MIRESLCNAREGNNQMLSYAEASNNACLSEEGRKVNRKIGGKRG